MLARSPDPTPAHRRRSPSIELELRDIGQLLDALDPSPLPERHLSADAEAFITSAAEEHPPKAPLTLRVHLRQWPATDPSAVIPAAVHH